MFSADDIAEGLKVQLRYDDIVISPYAKCGTTWLQQIVHTLRTRGDMDFEDISSVVPWIEMSKLLNIDLDAEQVANPRAFKSHLEYAQIPKGGRYIVSIRDPKDALYSSYRFMEGWFIEPGTISLDDFARRDFMRSRAYWQHLKSWWEQRNESNVLFLVYEHMKQDLDSTIQRVAEFVDVPLDDELLDITLEHASLPFMLKYKDRFDDALLRDLSEEKCNLPPESDSAKVRKGEIGEYEFEANLAMELDEIWKEEITAELGFADYASLIEMVSSED